MIRTFCQLFEILEQFGLRPCVVQGTNRFRRWSGFLQKCFIPTAWPSLRRPIGDDGLGRFFFRAPIDSSEYIHPKNASRLLQEAERIVNGSFRYFSYHSVELGVPPDWFRNPFTGQRFRGDQHWCEIADFAQEQGDIKFIWELSRFAWALTLARAYLVFGHDRYADTFWRLFEDWRQKNPPQMGPNWKCGQECGFRVMALSFCFHTLRHAPATTDSRVRDLVATIAVHAQRIGRHIELAMTLKNSHGVSEAAGLYTAGILFPALLQAEEWRRRGRALLVREALRQIYPDGSYVQHSMNYHRLVLQDLIWAGHLAKLNEDPFPKELMARLKSSLGFLCQMVDRDSGRVPNYGPNDGVCVLALNDCDYLDYRPVVQSLSYFVNRELLFERGPWDEDLVWLFGTEALNAPRRPMVQVSCAADFGGYYTIRGAQSWAMVRCHTYRDRPLQSDMLHLDLWHKGTNIFRDGGSYQYFCDPPWEAYFKSTAAHNTVEIAREDQMKPDGRFRWRRWVHSRLRHFETLPDRDLDYWEGEHYGYRRSRSRSVHRRAVVRWNDQWVIIDHVIGRKQAAVALRWRLADLGWRRSPGTGIFTADDGTRLMVYPPTDQDSELELLCGEGPPHPEGWESLYYGEKHPAPTVVCRVVGTLPMELITVLDCSGQAKWNVMRGKVCGRTQTMRAKIRLSAPSARAHRIAEISVSDEEQHT